MSDSTYVSDLHDINQKRQQTFAVWKKIKNAGAEFNSQTDYAAIDEFLKNQYGIQIYLDPEFGGIMPNFDIVDEQKFLIFNLKYS
jgi:hypothetical protein